MAATRTPQLDSFIKSEVPQPVKTADKELGKLQTFVLDALAPLTSLLESDAKGETIIHNQALDASKAAIHLLGNASAQISHMRRTKVIMHLNKSLLPLLEEDSFEIYALEEDFFERWACAWWPTYINSILIPRRRPSTMRKVWCTYWSAWAL